MDTAQLNHHRKLHDLQFSGEHYQRLLREGWNHWKGDRSLTLAYNRLMDRLEVWYEFPGQKPGLVCSIDRESFDIHKLCHQLYLGDPRERHHLDRIKEIEAREDAAEAEKQKAFEEAQAAHTDRVRWAVRKDTGNHVAPMSVPEMPKGVTSEAP